MRKFFFAVRYFFYFLISSYFLTEVALYAALRIGWFVPNVDGAYFDAPPAIFDEDRGFRWLNNAVRTARIMNGQIVYGPTRFPVDSRGYIWRSKFSDRRPRFAVLGDSFADAIFVERNWLEQAAARRRAEFVSFAIDGGGILNWRSVFFDEVLRDRRAFDGLIVAAYGNDLYRGFFAATSDRNFLYGHHYASPEAAKRKQDDLSGCPIALVVPRLYMRWVIALTNKKYLFGLNTAFLIYHYGAALLMEQMQRAGGACAITDYNFKTPQFDVLGEIVEAAVKRGMMVTIATVPARGELVDYLRNGTLPHDAREMDSFAKSHGINLFDGFAAFSSAMPKGMDPAAFVDNMWLQFDGHWNQRGSDLFANAIGDYLDRYGPGPHIGKSNP